MGKNWKELLEESYRSIDELKNVMTFSKGEEEKLKEIEKRYPICITHYYLSLINKGDKTDPILRMCMPDALEFEAGGSRDTSGEADNTVVTGMQHKYKQTALILSTNQCAMYCRHCFRKRMVGSNSEEIAAQLPVMADYVKNHSEINNVLISGGDSFLNSNKILKDYLNHFTPIENIEYIRFGTRTPVVLPQRITDDEELLRLLEEYSAKKKIYVVTQFNHPKEITPQSVKAVDMLQKAGCIVRNQTVLMRGINDNPHVLAKLMNQLTAVGVIPYYIFQCRPVEGVLTQFQIPLSEGSYIVEEAKKEMSGQSKSLHFVMSHQTGKIEILGNTENSKMLFKYHQAKYDKDESRIFEAAIEKGQCWLGNNI